MRAVLIIVVVFSMSRPAEAAPASHPTAASLSRRVVRKLDNWKGEAHARP